uniref:ACB domain-containing protein n=2 Tax=Ditylum brightwellii TaxID=49249 RepID=A0A7S4VFP5_9STRA
MSSSGTTPGAAFRAKAVMMKSWRPETTPSNRDRLELYALHKQAVSGDAPNKKPATDASVAEKAKMNAWRTKRGLSQVEAMSRYITECDRQIRVYGNKSASSAETAAGGGMRSSSSLPNTPGTPTNTPAANNGSSSNVDDENETILLTPRGLAAVPLLCAAASESRTSYITRLRSTTNENGWWARQEPLCADPNTPFATPENLVIALASKIESFSLSLLQGGRNHSAAAGAVVAPSVLQSYLWPTHNALLVIWIVLIFICTIIGSTLLTIRTILVGSKRTNVRLESIFQDEIKPCAKVASSLCDAHQNISVRLAGLALMPLVTLIDVSSSMLDSAGVLVGGGVYVMAVLVSWWYWICVLPWVACWSVGFSLMIGWCFALIDLAGV